MDATVNPFAALSLIVAPAILTNVFGSILLLQETRIAVQVLSERAATVRARAKSS